jgi:hypothetical protein
VVLLADHVDPLGQDFLGTLFDDDASTAIADGTAPFTGTFIPEEALSGFDGGEQAGAWTLLVVDGQASSGGTLDAAAVTVTHSGLCDPDFDFDGEPASIDCDDMNAAVNTSATEICGNGVDEDCVGGDLPCS